MDGGLKKSFLYKPISSGIQIFYRWFLLKNLQESNLLNSYKRFVITRSDFMFNIPHPRMSILDEGFVWVPNGQNYYGCVDRHVILSTRNIVPYLSLFNNMICKFDKYYKMMYKTGSQFILNSERLLKLHLQTVFLYHKVRRIPYIMYLVRPINGSSGFSKGHFNKDLNYYIKYLGEFSQAEMYCEKYNRFITEKGVALKSNDIDTFYRKNISEVSNITYKCIKCDFCTHPCITNNGGRHCCNSCKVSGTHGPSCKKKIYIKKQT